MKLKSLILTLLSIIILSSVVSIQTYQKAKIKNQVAGASTKQAEFIPVKGVILPHHELASDLIDQTLQSIGQQQQPQYIVIVGPNHWHPDQYHITTTTDLPNANLAQGQIQKLLKNLPFLSSDQQLLQNEHSITTLLPYLHRYFPQTLFIPLIFSPYYLPNQITQTTQQLTNQLPADTLYILSVDFAHNLMLLSALQNNQQSIIALKNFDYPTILNFQDDHLDSPVATVYFLNILKKLQATQWQTLHSTHGAEIIDQPLLRGTSYVIGTFR